MASILKVDTIQGATSATAVDVSGVTNLKMPSGFPVQVINGTNSTGVYHTSNATVKIMDVSITSKLQNSSFIVHSFCSIGTPGSVTGNSPPTWTALLPVRRVVFPLGLISQLTFARTLRSDLPVPSIPPQAFPA